MHYATLYQVKQYLGATGTGDDSRLIRFINESVKLIDRYKMRRFDVVRETRYFDLPVKDLLWVGNYDAAGYDVREYLWVDQDLLEVETLTNGDDTEIASTSYILLPANKYPKFKIKLKPSAGVAFTTDSSGNMEQVIDVLGKWGYHEDYDNAFEDSLDTVQDNPLSAVATTLTVGDADGVALDGSTQRFQAGQMLKIEDEFLYCAAVDNETNLLTVSRGYNGTTAAAHVQTTKIYIYRPMDNIVAACTRLTAWRYRQKDVDAFDEKQILGTGVRITPAMMPKDVVALLGKPKFLL